MYRSIARFLTLLLFSQLIYACKQEDAATSPVVMDIRPAADTLTRPSFAALSREQLYDKILGMLVGSAIGDAMGAPTEMWERAQIQAEYGHVDNLDEMVRAPSPEGTWGMNLPAGGTTDDTRWKVLLTDFITSQGPVLYEQDKAYSKAFATLIVKQYLKEIEGLKAVEGFEPEPFEYKAMRMAWLQEWALVAKPFAEEDLEGYSRALHRFYGGEMTCAGMLYAPMIGMAFPGAAEAAYKAAYQLALFDLGYARDLTGLTAAMVAAAMHPKANPDSILAVLRKVDPEHFFRSRLVGRTSYQIYQQAQYLVHKARQLRLSQVEPDELKLPFSGRDTLLVAQTQAAYEGIDELNQDRAFHAGEIHLINLSALLFCDFDFARSLEFVINYGRDNDTVGAITGSILGALKGFDQLPEHLARTVIDTNKNRLGIDLESLAQRLTDHLLSISQEEDTGD